MYCHDLIWSDLNLAIGKKPLPICPTPFLASLSEDLSETLGSGFSKRNLYNVRRLYLAHEENLQHAAKLT
ncbi:MAG: hypothetical protein IIA65_05580 [Planctomycetes bacterium]|nr:hypothetical protein [Planctomycetota bacterium]